MGYHCRPWRHQKDHKGVVRTILHTLIWQFRWNKPILQNAQTSMTHLVYNR